VRNRNNSPTGGWSLGRRAVVAVAALAAVAAVLPAASGAAADPREGLSAGIDNAGQASLNLEHLANRAKPAPVNNTNSDLAFRDDYAFVGNYNGFNIYDVSNPASPELKTTVLCPGSQNDVSIYGNLLFLSVESTAAKIDCTTSPAATAATRFRGVRIFDVSDIANPVQLAGVQTCRGSHTHTIVTDPADAANIYIYVSGTAGIRSAAEMPGCSAGSSLTDPNTANFRIDVIKVPLAAPGTAAVVSNPRVFSKCGSSACEADFATQHVHPIERYNTPALRGTLNWLNTSGTQPLYAADDPRAPGGQSVSQSSACHDITAYPEIGLAAGACQGDGILLDISDPVNPVRIDNVTDFNFAYWHSATFNNDGTKVVFTDEWGGGSAARCRPTDPANWGANAIFDIVDTPEGKKMEFRSYYKIPNTQTSQENCVAHNGSLIPVPGRDIMVQAWYQGGLSVFDFSDSANPKELAFFDRGPVSPTTLISGGFWSTYWFNGNIFGSEIARGFDAFALKPSADLSANEIAAAGEATVGTFNTQHQARYVNAPSFAVARSYRDQLVRSNTLQGDLLAQVDKFVDRAERFSTGPQAQAAKANLHALANQGQLQGDEFASLRAALRALADA
jgi:hypothetical protein